MAEENFMDQFDSPEDFIRHQILSRGNFSTLDKKKMYRLIREHNIEFTIKKNGLEYTKKKDMFDALLTSLSFRDLASYVGVLRKSFCVKFDITIDEFQTLVRDGLIHKTHSFTSVKNPYSANPIWSKWDWYNVYDYFDLTRDIVQKALNKLD